MSDDPNLNAAPSNKSIPTTMIVRLACAFCFALGVKGLLTVLSSAAEFLDDSHLPAGPAGASRWGVWCAPYGWSYYPILILATTCHWLLGKDSKWSGFSLLWHGLAAMTGAGLMTGAWIIQWYGTSLNGERPATWQGISINTGVIVVLLATIIRRTLHRNKTD